MTVRHMENIFYIMKEKHEKRAVLESLQIQLFIPCHF